ncbi:MAG: threonine--tRNA ligase [Candidatus Aenigmatarchaeota archaeon]
MKILTIHSDFLEVEPKTKAIKSAEEIDKAKKRIEDCLVVFTSVEDGDRESVAEKTAKEIADVAEQVKAKKIVLYPFVHLTSKPASPDTALAVLKETEKILEKNYEVYRAPFGWYKAFTIKCKGHPLAELSREIKEIEGSAKQEDVISGALKQEEQVKSEWLIMSPDGTITPAEKFDFKNHKNLGKFYNYEVAKVRGVASEPPHVKLMRALELVDYEEGSDPGNLKYYPKGRLIKSLLEQWVTNKVIKYGAMEVETPIMYDFEHPALKSYLNRFPARQYIVESAKKKFFLRFSACFGQFLMKSKMTISYKDLPLKMYELTRYSFRLEKAGELVGLRRLRAFTMPDMHTLCKNLEAAREEFRKQYELSIQCLNEIDIQKNDFETAIRFTKDFWENNKDFVASLAKLMGKPVLIERWSFRFAYFDPKFEFNFVDSMDKCSALSTVQIDHENAERYGVQYTDEDNAKKYPTILHCSPSGAIERCIYAMLEKAHMESEKGKNPMFPLWLSPTQVRLCPMNDSLVGYCEKLADELAEQNIRVDIDDRAESVQKKIRSAEMEWVPYAVVVGEKEKESGSLAVRFRETGKVGNLKPQELVKIIAEKTKDFPFKQLPLPRLLSKRPVFVG